VKVKCFHPPVNDWFNASFKAPTEAQKKAWPPILAGESTLLLAPTGSGKTLAAFLAAIDRLMFAPAPDKQARCRVVYVSPLKALASDIERNLRAPLVGIAAMAAQHNVTFQTPEVMLRFGDTPSRERTRFLRESADIVITTPESLYLLLTSQPAALFHSVETVIVDEIHSLVGSKRGAHLFLTLERLMALRAPEQPALQRIGLSATQRPLDEVARFLGGGTLTPDQGAEGGYRYTSRPVTIVSAGIKKTLELSVEVALADRSKVTEDEDIPSGPAAGPSTPSIWPSIYPRLVEHIRAHRSTMIFVNSRRLAERLANAINETAGEELALAHHGSIAREQRVVIEDRLKSGTLPAIVATSSLELGLDIGAVDLVIQVEAPPSVASGLQRIGRAGHSVGEVSRGVIIPKFRGDLLTCAAATHLMHQGAVEATYYPRNPLDVLAQQIVAMTSIERLEVEILYRRVRGAAPFAELPRSLFEGVLDMLSGRYPSDDFAELRPRITWDRIGGTVTARTGAKRLAVNNVGTIPDRGLYGVFLQGSSGNAVRVGELDEEMVFEARAGEIFLLGASSWRIEEITHDRVWVTPAPGEEGKMPFWRGDRMGRSAEFGRAVGELTRLIASQPPPMAAQRLTTDHDLAQNAAEHLVTYVHEQRDATGEVPSDRTLVVERYLDELGDFRVCILSPFGSRVHAPWATAVIARCREDFGAEADVLWSDDGIVFRLPEANEPPDVALFFPSADEIEDLVVRSLAQTALFAAHFRENASRALLIPRRYPGKRTPLWAQRRKSAQLLAVAAQYGSFPIVLETYRECLRDVFDLPALHQLLRDVASRKLRVHVVEARTPSPFSASLMFNYVSNFIYDGDAPLAERRAQALSLDQSLLRELLGQEEIHELLDADVLEELERQLQRMDGRPLRDKDEVHDLLLMLGDLTLEALQQRGAPPEVTADWLSELVKERRVYVARIKEEERYVAAEDAARYRDTLGIMPPPGLPTAFLQQTPDPWSDLVSRYARTHGPFAATQLAAHFGVAVPIVEHGVRRLVERGRIVEGLFLAQEKQPSFCESHVLRTLKKRSLAKLRKQVEPAPHEALARFLWQWQGIAQRTVGADGLLRVVEQLQGLPLPFSDLEQAILPARSLGFRPEQLDALCAQGLVIWRGVDPLALRDGRVALYLADRYSLLAPAVQNVENALAQELENLLQARGALFFWQITTELKSFPRDLRDALWELVWAGRVTNDTLSPLRSMFFEDKPRSRTRPRDAARASWSKLLANRAQTLPGTEGRWSLLPTAERVAQWPSATEQRMALSLSLLERYGIVTREEVTAEGVAGGFSAVYEPLKIMEERGQVRRGYFVSGLGAAQFAQPGAEERLRFLRESSEEPQTWVLGATDPANPYGAAIAWPDTTQEGRLSRSAGAWVVIDDGVLLAYLGKSARTLVTIKASQEVNAAAVATRIATALARFLREGPYPYILLKTIDGAFPATAPIEDALVRQGFRRLREGYLLRRPKPTSPNFIDHKRERL